MFNRFKLVVLEVAELVLFVSLVVAVVGYEVVSLIHFCLSRM
jgi:hypothetical protein